MWNENMELTTRTLPAQKHIALVAHDHCKDMLMKWVARHQALLAQHILYATGTTGNLVSRATGLEVNAMLSGPMGGDWIIKSAVETLVATGMFQTVARRSNALTSGSWGTAFSGSQKKISTSILPSEMRAPTCWSPHFGQPLDILIPDYPRYLAERLK